MLSVTPSSIELVANSGIPVTLTVANTSSDTTATAISALLPLGWTDVVQDASGCASLPPQAQCTLSCRSRSGSGYIQLQLVLLELDRI